MTDQALAHTPTATLTHVVDPVTRYVRFSYPTPDDAPDEVTVRFACRLHEQQDWQPAGVLPHISQTARRLMPAEQWDDAVLRGTFTEQVSAKLTRNVLFDPFRIGVRKGTFEFRITLSHGNVTIEQMQTSVHVDNDDVIVLDDWSRVLQSHAMDKSPLPGAQVWRAANDGLRVDTKGVTVPQLTYPWNLKGMHALFITLPATLGAIELRLSGDERTQYFENQRAGDTAFWRWADMTRQHLVIKQPHRTMSYCQLLCSVFMIRRLVV